MPTIVRDVMGMFCIGCGISDPLDDHTCPMADDLLLTDAEIAIQTLQDSIINNARIWAQCHYSLSTREGATKRMTQWLEQATKLIRVHRYWAEQKRRADGIP